jgi:transcriptional regulator with XRE-family HTH domain
LYTKFAKLLQENNETAYQVAKLTQISTSTLSDWKTGRSKPKIDKLQKIADHFKVPITHFLEEKNDKKED